MFRSFKFYVDQILKPDEMCRALAELGYRHQDRVQEEGDFSRRGSVLDVYPATFECPLRVSWDDDKIASISSFVLSSGDLFSKHEIVIILPRRSYRKNAFTHDLPLESFVDIRVGDRVVHSQHGIGIYAGIRKSGEDGLTKDHAVIRYHGEDRLFVPVEQMHLVQKYVGLGKKHPRLHRMGSGEWKRSKLRAQKATVNVAMDLLTLQALRKSLGGFQFSKDTAWQAEFEQGFPYEETPDQKTAIEQTKRDMEASIVMDRLLCGDVGYGKTEVAMRAAFKSVMSGKQVAILVPTTILAEQHHHNFKKRLGSFPVELEMLSRFKTTAEQKLIIARLACGKIDIVIGTHRLLSEDISFKDLGLVIIDEEQRFGVKAKERLKQVRSVVDVLTLTATPIPRTLYMALMGAKDISNINTPPLNRLSIETHVVQKDRHLLRQALKKELQRQGQVYFIHNRVEDIEKVKDEVTRLAGAGVRVEYAHGQMPSKVLEKIMIDFLEGDIDVLVSTTIVESGIDVPNANTLIVNNADYFGLADLHQLRGRVGRFNRRAYAYFVVAADKPLTRESRRRLEAIHEFCELGSGYKIAMEDLELRGAGNLLGVRQHGHIAAVGFDLYCRMLKESVASLSSRLAS